MNQNEYIGLERDLEIELKKYEKNETNRRGIILTIRRADNHDEAVRKMIEYLNSTNKKDRDSLIRYAYKLIGKNL